MRNIAFEELTSLLEEAIDSVIDIALNDGNELVVFFQEGTNKEVIKTFVRFFHLKILGPNKNTKHQMFTFGTENQRVSEYQLFFRVKKLPPIKKGDVVIIFVVVPPDIKISRTFVL